MNAFRANIFVRLGVALGGMALVSGCVTTAAGQRIPSRGVASDSNLEANEGIVYGAVLNSYLDYSSGNAVDLAKAPEIAYRLTTEIGPPTLLGATFSPFSTVLSPERGILGDNRQRRVLFAKRFTAGENSMNRIDFSYQQGQAAAPLFVRFNVAPGKATYIGSLQLSFRGGKGLFGEHRVRDFLVAVVDEYAEVTRMYRESNPKNTSETRSELMRVER